MDLAQTSRSPSPSLKVLSYPVQDNISLLLPGSQLKLLLLLLLLALLLLLLPLELPLVLPSTLNPQPLLAATQPDDFFAEPAYTQVCFQFTCFRKPQQQTQLPIILIPLSALNFLPARRIKMINFSKGEQARLYLWRMSTKCNAALFLHSCTTYRWLRNNLILDQQEICILRFFEM